jgi:hypothetical protein
MQPQVDVCCLRTRKQLYSTPELVACFVVYCTDSSVPELGALGCATLALVGMPGMALLKCCCVTLLCAATCSTTGAEDDIVGNARARWPERAAHAQCAQQI